eukprot:1138530-Pelagomonas_calceolata.AAC.3
MEEGQDEKCCVKRRVDLLERWAFQVYTVHLGQLNFLVLPGGFYGVYDALFERLAKQEGKVREERQVGASQICDNQHGRCSLGCGAHMTCRVLAGFHKAKSTLFNLHAWQITMMARFVSCT